MFTTSAIVEISEERCVGCTRCVNVCPSDALALHGRLAVLEEEKCVGCFKCLEACIGYDAISIKRDPHPRELTTPITDSASVVELCQAARLEADSIICVCTQTTAGEVAAAILEGSSGPRPAPRAQRGKSMPAQPRTGAAADVGIVCS